MSLESIPPHDTYEQGSPRNGAHSQDDIFEPMYALHFCASCAHDRVHRPGVEYLRAEDIKAGLLLCEIALHINQGCMCVCMCMRVHVYLLAYVGTCPYDSR